MPSNKVHQTIRKKVKPTCVYIRDTASLDSKSSINAIRDDFNCDDNIQEFQNCEMCFGKNGSCSCFNCVIAGCTIKDSPVVEESINIIYTSIFKCRCPPCVTQLLLSNITTAYASSLSPNSLTTLNILLSTILGNPIYAIDVGMESIAAANLPANTSIPRCDFGSIPYYVNLPSQTTSSEIEITWPILKVVQDLARTMNGTSFITVTMALVVLSNNPILDSNTACPIKVNNIFSAVTQNPTTGVPNGLNNICLALDDIKNKFGLIAVPFISQFFVFKTPTILGFLQGNFTIAVVFLTDFTGLTFPYITIFDNCSGNILFQLGNPSIPFTFIPKCKQKSKYIKNNKDNFWVLQHETQLLTVNLNAFQQILFA
ncbi:MAG: hypothetical protein Harvfovirus43_8 [Harvfovirus sp.]|uniref:Uncharacterized protein n=1 Tax=Harvfovirus sp. TaxID=2487768 RepID=A0A3G5A2Y4_9VIRU|nr:MAG: hypothetical protein Harvfovirus43_8 [Harvfovirus sp.]